MKKIVSFLCGSLVTVMIMSTATAFAETADKIDVVFNRIQLMVNGEKVKEDTLLHNGTTYIPLRAVAETLDKEMTWDPSSNTAYIDDKGTNRVIEEKQENSDSNYYAEVPIVPDFNKVNNLDYLQKYKNYGSINSYYNEDAKIEEYDAGYNTIVYNYRSDELTYQNQSELFKTLGENYKEALLAENFIETKLSFSSGNSAYVKDNILVVYGTFDGGNHAGIFVTIYDNAELFLSNSKVGGIVFMVRE